MQSMNLNAEDHGPSITFEQVPRLSVDNPEELKQHFLEHGFVVVRDVATREELARAHELAWQFIEGTGLGAKRNKPDTWSNSHWPAHPFSGIAYAYGVGQSEFCWHLRGLPPVRQAFEILWEEKDLIVSFDGANFFRPWKHDKEWRTFGGWYHVDQNGVKTPGLQTIQGLVTVFDATPETGGFVCVPGSHHDHQAVCERCKCTPETRDFVQLNDNDPVLKEKRAIMVGCQAGDLILWDSRLVHCNAPGVDTTPPKSGITALLDKMKLSQPNADIIRAVGYVCMGPRSKATPEVLEKRKEAFERGVTTTHWPHEFRVTSQMAREGEKFQQAFELTEQQKQLI